MLSPVQCDQLKKKIIPKIEGIDFHLSGPHLPGCPNPRKGEAMGHTKSEGSQNGPFLSQQALVSSKPPTRTPSLHPHLCWKGPVPFQPLPLLLAPSGASCCLSSPSPFRRSCLRCCSDSLTLQRHQSEWKNPNQAPGCAALYIFYSDSRAGPGNSPLPLT